MARRLFPVAALAIAFVLALEAAPPPPAPVNLARQPDYHAGSIVFSYLGDIWMAREDGSNVRQLTNNIARETSPRFSPDGKTIAFSSNRHGSNDVYVVPVAGGVPERLTFHSGNDEVVGAAKIQRDRQTAGDCDFGVAARARSPPDLPKRSNRAGNSARVAIPRGPPEAGPVARYRRLRNSSRGNQKPKREDDGRGPGAI